mmetsp:Transcript_48383/g.105322  ORF Transcript_48383/g.105322 Transcript_48383/m.105322 type:complete len:82 (+) Transcript_48383:61-306(+)
MAGKPRAGLLATGRRCALSLHTALVCRPSDCPAARLIFPLCCTELVCVGRERASCGSDLMRWFATLDPPPEQARASWHQRK